jgi:hypothetical protein
MKIKIDKNWFKQRIALEGDSEIGAGNPHFMKENVPAKVVVNKIQKSFTHRLDNRWEWTVIVWKHATMFASFTIHSTGSFDEERWAEKDMNETLEL